MMICFYQMSSVAMGAGATIEGTKTIREGETFKLDIIIPESGQYGLEGTFDFDASKVTLTKVTSLRKGWKVETNNRAIVAYDDALSNPTAKNTRLISATFKVKSGVSAGEVISISLNGLTVSDGVTEKQYGSIKHSLTVARPLSTDNYIKSLTVSNGGTISPKFDGKILKYRLTDVEYDVASLKIEVVLSDDKAKYNISGNKLVVGENKVSINVVAENGSKRTYTILVNRKQDPNYVPSSECKLKGIDVSGGQLSPTFNENITNYVVYMPLEESGKLFEINGSAKDNKAKGVTGDKIVSLKEGSNTLKVVCTAEDGTKKEYTVIAYVMPKYSGKLPIMGNNSENEVPVSTLKPTTTPEPEETNSPVTTDKPAQEDGKGENKEYETEKSDNKREEIRFSLWVTILFVMLGMVAGILIGVLLVTKKYKNKSQT